MTRFIPKQFAENSTTSVVFGSHQEQGGKVGDGTISSDPATLQGGAAWPLGWKAATENFFQIPRGEEMEGLERVLSAAIIQQFKDGLTFWQPEMPVTQYQSIVQYQTGSNLPKLYVNITGTSTSTPPDSDTTNWFMFFDTAQVSANVDLSNLSATGQAVLNGKANTSLSNLTASGEAHFSKPDFSNATKPYVIETYHSGPTWHIVFSDGFKMQGGFIGSLAASASVTVSFSKPFSETNYFCCPSWSNASYGAVGWSARTKTGMTLLNSCGGATAIFWMACGY